MTSYQEPDEDDIYYDEFVRPLESGPEFYPDYGDSIVSPRDAASYLLLVSNSKGYFPADMQLSSEFKYKFNKTFIDISKRIIKGMIVSFATPISLASTGVNDAIKEIGFHSLAANLSVQKGKTKIISDKNYKEWEEKVKAANGSIRYSNNNKLQIIGNVKDQ